MADAERKNPHDALFKDVFSRPENALAVFRAELPPSLGANLHSLRPATSEYQDELRRSLGDLVFTARLGRARTHLSLLFEHLLRGPHDRVGEGAVTHPRPGGRRPDASAEPGPA